MANPTAAMIVIGDEILSGRTRDSNLHYLAKQLALVGIDLQESRIVLDVSNDIIDATNALRSRYTYVFTSGGIGPTHDDITADSIAAAFEVSIDVRADARAILATNYKDPDKELTQARLRMARIPDGATLIDNPVSRAPGFSVENVHVMAGVPAVFEAMLDGLLPKLGAGKRVLSHTVHTNMKEGDIANPLGAIARENPDVSIGSYPYYKDGTFGCNLVVRSTEQNRLDEVAAQIEAAIQKLGE
ncbi:MAG: competence/damage-inducible protein A [Rhodobacteraceae bacterium]|nr:MAG: competence/damage-inducible protein A [Paracoccaceae bacterium]